MKPLSESSARVLERLESLKEANDRQFRRLEGFQAGDPKMVARNQPRKSTAAEKEAWKDKNRRNWLLGCDVPPAYLHCSKKSWDGQRSRWVTEIDSWNGSPWCLTLKGSPGTGKTHLAVALLAEWARRNGIPRRTRFISVPTAIRDIREAYAADDGRTVWSKRPADFYRWVATTWDLVVFDDVGAQPVDRDNWTREVSGWLYDRHATQLPTVVTLNPEDQKGLEDRAARRIGDGVVIDMSVAKNQTKGG